VVAKREAYGMSETGTATGADRIDVRYVANLARLHLRDEEAECLQEQMEQIVHYVHKLDEVDVVDVEPTAHAVEITNVLRPDEPREGLAHDVVMANAPAEIDGQFMVPKIVE